MTHGATLVGRESELQHLLAALAPGSACRMMLAAPPGTGKTALVEAFLTATAELEVTVLRVRPTEVDQWLAFSGLTDLLAPLEDDAYDGLPAPQQRAIRAALLLEDADGEVDPRAVAAALSAVLVALAADRPVLVVLDDVQWLDHATAMVLSHSLRRLGDATVHVVAVGRAEEWPLVLDDAATLTLPPLGTAALFHVVKDHLGLALDRAGLRAVEQASGGNPLYALELVRRRGGKGASTTLDELISARVRELPLATRRSLLRVALAASPRPDVLAAAAGCTPEELLADLEPARTTGLIRITDSVLFAHPLYAEAVVEEAADLEIRDAHRRLAEVETDPEARARHLGAAASAPHAGLAGRLDDAATSARNRGAWASAIELLRLAAELTPDDTTRTLRTVQLGEWLTTSGRTAEAETAFIRIRATARGLAYWRATIGLGRLWATAGREPEALALVGDVVGTDAPPTLQAEALLVLGDEGDRSEDHVARAVAVLEPLKRTAGVDRLLATALVTLSWLRAEKGEPYADLLASAVELQQDSPPERVADSADLVIAQQALFSDRYDDGRAALARLIRRCEETGDDFSLPSLLANLAHLEYRAGRWDDSERALIEGRRLSEGQRQAHWQLIGAQLMMLIGLRGDRERARTEAASLQGGDLTTTDPAWSAIVESCVGKVELAHGDADAAFATLSRAIGLAESVDWTDPGQTGIDVTWFDAGIASGHLDEVEARLTVVEERAERLQRSAVLLGCRRARLALAVANGDADRVVGELPDLLTAYDTADCPPMERAHAHVFAGKVYRRARKKRLAHQAFTFALGIYEQIGCPPYADQARAELARVGLRPGAPEALTETERRVASLAADGLRNKEIAHQLFMSPKTVEANLSRAYRKLGVRARTDLARALTD